MESVKSSVEKNNRSMAEFVFSFALSKVKLNESYMQYVPDGLKALLRDMGTYTFSGLIDLMQACVVGDGFESLLVILQTRNVVPMRVKSTLESCGIPCRAPLDRFH